MKKIMLSLLALVAVVSAVGCAGTASTSPPRTLTVNGTHQVFVAPDIAYVTIGVHTESEEVATAVDDNNAAVEKVMAALREMGVEDKDMQTTNFSIYKNEKWDFEGRSTGFVFSVDNNVYLIVRNLASLSDVLDAAITAGANNIWGVQFDKSDKTAALADGRKEATEKAMVQAQELAENAGVELGEIYSISHYSGGYAAPISYGGYGGGGGGFAESAAVPISAGQLVIQVDVNIVYTIK
jgi:uncharacterized protein YggE